MNVHSVPCREIKKRQGRSALPRWFILLLFSPLSHTPCILPSVTTSNNAHNTNKMIFRSTMLAL